MEAANYFRPRPPPSSPPRHDQPDFQVEWERLRVMWILVSTLFLLWMLLMAVQHLFRSVALWKVSKGDYTSPLVVATGVAQEGTEAPPATGWESPTSQPASTSSSEWLLRFRHASKLTRNVTMALLVTTLLAQLLMFRRSPWEPDRPSPGHPLPGGPHAVPNDDRFHYHHPVTMWIPYVLTLIIFVLTTVQILIHLVVEPLARSSSRHRGYEYFGPGVYGGRHEIAGKWIDPVFDLARVIMLILLVTVALSSASQSTYSG